MDNSTEKTLPVSEEPKVTDRRNFLKAGLASVLSGAIGYSAAKSEKNEALLHAIENREVLTDPLAILFMDAAREVAGKVNNQPENGEMHVRLAHIIESIKTLALEIPSPPLPNEGNSGTVTKLSPALDNS